MADYKDIKPAGKDTGAPLNVARRIALIARHMDLKGKEILDCGCGGGEYVKALLEYSSHVHGVEYSEEKVKTFKVSFGDSVDVNTGSIEELKFADNTFDLVLLNEVIEHVTDEERALKEILRVLKPDGMLAVFAPNRLYPFETHGVVIKKTGKVVPHFVPFIPYVPLALGNRIFIYGARNYSPWRLKRIVAKAGFIVIGQTYIWQTFENISGISPAILVRMSGILRKISFFLERVPLARMFGVSQVIIAKKPVRPNANA